MLTPGVWKEGLGVGESRGRGARERRPARASREELQGNHVIREALRARRRPLHRLRVRGGDRGAEVEDLRALAERVGIPCVEDGRLAEAAVGQPRMAVLEAGPLPQLSLSDLMGIRPDQGWRLVALDGVEDPQNVGAIARVAEGVGAHALILTVRRAPPLTPAVSRASAGALEWLPVVRVPNLVRALAGLKAAGVWCFGADVAAPHSLYEIPERWLHGDRVLVLGAEGRGLREGVRRSLDFRIEIPTFGRVSSLNVAAAAAVVLFEFQRRS